LDSRRASHAPASVDTETSATAIHAPPPGGSPPSSTGPMACVQYASGIFRHPLSSRQRKSEGGSMTALPVELALVGEKPVHRCAGPRAYRVRRRRLRLRKAERRAISLLQFQEQASQLTNVIF
jgi:hypothetical protein